MADASNPLCKDNGNESVVVIATNRDHYIESRDEDDPFFDINDELGGQEQKQGFRFCAKSVLATYPHCNIPKEEMLIHFSGTLGARICVVGAEKHQDGTPHLHVYAQFDRKIDSRNCRYFDYADFHPNLVSHIKSPKKAVEYVIKDGDYCQTQGFNAAEFLARKRSRIEIACEEIITGRKTVCQVINETPELLLKMDTLQRNLNLFNAQLEKEGLTRDECWIATKKRHFWIHGPSNTGKTTWLKSLIAFQPSQWFEIPTNDDWSGYTGQPYLWMDEFKGQLTIQQLNKICEGGCKVNMKFSGGKLYHHPQVFIVSNYCIEECYSNVHRNILETLNNRFYSYGMFLVLI